MKITVVGGAGGVGSSVVFGLATQVMAEELVLIDIRQNVLENHVLDIQDTVVACNRIAVVRAGSYPDITGSDIVISFRDSSVVGRIADTKVAGTRKTHHSWHQYCKGCGICARICPVKAIALAREV